MATLKSGEIQDLCGIVEESLGVIIPLVEESGVLDAENAKRYGKRMAGAKRAVDKLRRNKVLFAPGFAGLVLKMEQFLHNYIRSDWASLGDVYQHYLDVYGSPVEDRERVAAAAKKIGGSSSGRFSPTKTSIGQGWNTTGEQATNSNLQTSGAKAAAPAVLLPPTTGVASPTIPKVAGVLGLEKVEGQVSGASTVADSSTMTAQRKASRCVVSSEFVKEEMDEEDALPPPPLPHAGRMDLRTTGGGVGTTPGKLRAEVVLISRSKHLPLVSKCTPGCRDALETPLANHGIAKAVPPPSVKAPADDQEGPDDVEDGDSEGDQELEDTDEEWEEEVEEDDAPVLSGSKRKAPTTKGSSQLKKQKRVTFAEYFEKEAKHTDCVYDLRCDFCTKQAVEHPCTGSVTSSRCHTCVHRKGICTWNGVKRPRPKGLKRVKKNVKSVKGKAKVKAKVAKAKEEEGDAEDVPEVVSADDTFGSGKDEEEDEEWGGIAVDADLDGTAARTIYWSPTCSHQVPGIGLDGFSIPARYTYTLDLEDRRGLLRLQLEFVKNRIQEVKAEMDVKYGEIVFLRDLAAALDRRLVESGKP